MTEADQAEVMAGPRTRPAGLVLGPVLVSLAWPGLVWHGLAWSGMAGPGQDWPRLLPRPVLINS